MDGMVLLLGIALTMIGLLVIVMVAMTRHLLAHPDDTLRGQGSGSWSDGLAGTEAAPEAPPARTPAPAPRQPSPRPSGTVPLDDMPADVVAEVARRVAQRRD